MSYEKDAISTHVETHFLTLDSYGRMYEKKRIQRLEAEKKEEKVKEPVDRVEDATNQNDMINHSGVNSIENGAEESRNEEKGKGLKNVEGRAGNEKVLSKSEAKCDDLDELNKSLAKLAESVVGKKKAEVKIHDLKHQPNDFHKVNGNSSKVGKEIGNEKVVDKENLVEKETDAEKETDVERTAESQHKLSIESPTGKESKDDVFVYLCPFPACDFSTDFEVGLSFYQVSNRLGSSLQGMKYGPAASHGVEVHNTQPYEVKMTCKARHNFLSACEVFFTLFHQQLPVSFLCLEQK